MCTCGHAHARTTQMHAQPRTTTHARTPRTHQASGALAAVVKSTSSLLPTVQLSIPKCACVGRSDDSEERMVGSAARTTSRYFCPTCMGALCVRAA